MVKFLAGSKGEGKTNKLIGLANENLTLTDGHLVFIDDDKRHIHDLHRDIRFVEVEKGLLANHREFTAFLHGVLSQNSDIAHVYIDGLSNIIENFCETNELPPFFKTLEALSEKENVNFTVSIDCEKEKLPPAVATILI